MIGTAGRLPFRAVNRRGYPGYDRGLQRHHLIPCQALTMRGLSSMFRDLGKARIGFDDFRRNGLLLPAHEKSARRIGLPLHRGPHRVYYNEMVIERLGAIERAWSRQLLSSSEDAHMNALMRIALLQQALRRRLLNTRQPVQLNSKDPLGQTKDYTLLDAMAEQLWQMPIKP